MLRGITLAAALALSALGAASAQSTVVVPVTLDEDTGGFFKSVKNAFSYDFTFDLTDPGLLTASLTSAAVTNPIVFTHVTLNGVSLVKDPTSNSYALPDAIDALAGLQVFHIEGVASSKNTTFSGTVQFITAVPEPAGWTMMMVGFGALGLTMRRRKPLGLLTA